MYRDVTSIARQLEYKCTQKNALTVDAAKSECFITTLTAKELGTEVYINTYILPEAITNLNLCSSTQ